MFNIEDLKDYGDDVRNGLENILEEDADENYFDNEERQVIKKALAIIKNKMKELIVEKPTKKQLLKMPKGYLKRLLDFSNISYSNKLSKKELVDKYYEELAEGYLEDLSNA